LDASIAAYTAQKEQEMKLKDISDKSKANEKEAEVGRLRAAQQRVSNTLTPI